MKTSPRESSFEWPIITDNRNLRKDIPAINTFFAMAREELSDLPRENNVIVDPEIVEFCDCPVCDSTYAEQQFVKFGFIYARCPVCDHLFVQNRLRENVLMGLYATSEIDRIDRTIKSSPSHLEYWHQLYAKYLGYVQQRGGSNPNLLDVGCGAGNFLSYCKENTDLALNGLDFCEDTFESIVEMVGRQNYYYQQKIDDIDFGDKRFGVITFWGVMEHLTHPKPVLEKCARILDADGLILLLVPNPGSRAIKILGVTTPTLAPRAHINLFSEKSLTYLCRKIGLEIAARYQELPVIDLMHPHISYNEELIRELVRHKECYYDVYILRVKSA